MEKFLLENSTTIATYTLTIMVGCIALYVITDMNIKKQKNKNIEPDYQLASIRLLSFLCCLVAPLLLMVILLWVGLNNESTKFFFATIIISVIFIISVLSLKTLFKKL